MVGSLHYFPFVITYRWPDYSLFDCSFLCLILHVPVFFNTKIFVKIIFFNYQSQRQQNTADSSMENVSDVHLEVGHDVACTFL